MAYGQDENSLKLLIERYKQKIFALALYLIGGDRNKAYDVASSSFAKALRTTSPLETNDIILVRIAHAAVEKSRDVKIIPFSDDSDFMELPAVKRESLRIIKTALLSLPFDQRVALLLRDQLHLPYKDISAVLEVSEKDAKSQTTQARIKLRKEVERVLSS